MNDGNPERRKHSPKAHSRDKRPSGDGALTRADIAGRIYDIVPLRSRQEASQIVDSVIDGICDALAGGENVKLSGFGTFRLHDKDQRVGRNPLTGEEKPITARRVVLFSASPLMRGAINAPEGAADAQADSAKGKRGRKRRKQGRGGKLEASEGIEPPYKDLQSSA